MTKNKVIHLTREELSELIYEAVLPVLNEIDAREYARVHKATNKARIDNQNGVLHHRINSNTIEPNDDIIAHGIELEPRAADSFISPYKDVRFMFYCKNLRQNTGIVLFSLSVLHELTDEKAILRGDVVFNNERLNGSIIINLATGNAVYCHSRSRRKYPLEIDNRFAPKWNELVDVLREASRLIYEQ